MKANTDTLEKSASTQARERVLGDLKSLTQDAEDLLKATAGDLSDKAKDARTRMAAALERAKSTCEDLQEQAGATARAAAKKADSMIRDHPYESIGIAFGVGLLLGVVLTRK